MVNLKVNSKSHPILRRVSMVTVSDYSADQSQNPSRVSADTPAGIADLFNRFFASVFTIDSAVEKTACIRSDTIISDLTLNEATILAAFKALEVDKATGRTKSLLNCSRRLPQCLLLPYVGSSTNHFN